MIQSLALAVILIAAAALCVWLIARQMMQSSREGDLWKCDCPVLLLKTQDRDGLHLKQFHTTRCRQLSREAVLMRRESPPREKETVTK